MMTLVIGTSDSGKSALAEKLCLETGDENRYYLATMKVLDSEGEERIRRHRAMREGKGFVTIERPLAPAGAVSEMADPAHATVLLECVANLVGNEMHSRDIGESMPDLQQDRPVELFADAVAAEIMGLSESVHNLIAVTDDYPSDSPDYDQETRLYIRLLDLVNARLVRLADRVVDVRENRQEKGEVI